MTDSLLLHLLLNISLLLLSASMLTELRPLRSILKNPRESVLNQIYLGVIFGLLSVTCTYMGLNFQGAIVNIRVVSTMTAGLMGGPIPGLLAGFISGLHRYLYDPHGFTSLACGIGTFCFGVIGAVFYRKFSLRRSYLLLVLLTVVSELVQCVIIRLVAKPFEAALALERAILLPKIVINSLGIVMFVWLFNRLNRSVTIELVEHQSRAMQIAQECLPYLKEGIENCAAMQQVTDIVWKYFPSFKVIITDRHEVLASSGIALSSSALPSPSLQAISSGQLQVIKNYCEEFDTSFHPDAAIAAPFKWQNEVVGTLLLIVPMSPTLILDADIHTTESLAQLFSSTLALGELQHQMDLRQQAEFRALQSQINPHFLFNALNTISALCLTDPDKAREMILVLANYFRQTLSINEPFVTLEQELNNVDNYLSLTKARFEDAIHVTRELPDNLTRLRMPPLILQPIVENAVRHGWLAIDDRRVDIRINQDNERAYIRISDKGKGFPEDVLQKIEDLNNSCYTGLFNVRKRLHSIYGNQCEFSIDSSENGSVVSFSIPLNPPGETSVLF